MNNMLRKDLQTVFFGERNSNVNALNEAEKTSHASELAQKGDLVAVDARQYIKSLESFLDKIESDMSLPSENRKFIYKKGKFGDVKVVPKPNTPAAPVIDTTNKSTPDSKTVDDAKNDNSKERVDKILSNDRIKKLVDTFGADYLNALFDVLDDNNLTDKEGPSLVNAVEKLRNVLKKIKDRREKVVKEEDSIGTDFNDIDIYELTELIDILELKRVKKAAKKAAQPVPKAVNSKKNKNNIPQTPATNVSSQTTKNVQQTTQQDPSQSENEPKMRDDLDIPDDATSINIPTAEPKKDRDPTIASEDEIKQFIFDKNDELNEFVKLYKDSGINAADTVLLGNVINSDISTKKLSIEILTTSGRTLFSGKVKLSKTGNTVDVPLTLARVLTPFNKRGVGRFFKR